MLASFRYQFSNCCWTDFCIFWQVVFYIVLGTIYDYFLCGGGGTDFEPFGPQTLQNYGIREINRNTNVGGMECASKCTLQW